MQADAAHDASLLSEVNMGLTRCQKGGHGQHAQREAKLGDASHDGALWFVCGCV